MFYFFFQILKMAKILRLRPSGFAQDDRLKTTRFTQMTKITRPFDFAQGDITSLRSG